MKGNDMGNKAEKLRAWVMELHDEPVEVNDDTDLIESGLVSSLQFVSMVVEIEKIHGMPLAPGDITINSMRSIRAVDDKIFQGQ
jgi:phosphopantetheine attachment domain protein